MKTPKRMFFRKSSKKGGSFPIQKFILQIFAIINGTLVMNSGKNLQYNFPKTRGGGGSKAIWNFSEKTSVLVSSVVPKLKWTFFHRLSSFFGRCSLFFIALVPLVALVALVTWVPALVAMMARMPVCPHASKYFLLPPEHPLDPIRSQSNGPSVSRFDIMISLHL